MDFGPEVLFIPLGLVYLFRNLYIRSCCNVRRAKCIKCKKIYQGCIALYEFKESGTTKKYTIEIHEKYFTSRKEGKKYKVLVSNNNPYKVVSYSSYWAEIFLGIFCLSLSIMYILL